MSKNSLARESDLSDMLALHLVRFCSLYGCGEMEMNTIREYGFSRAREGCGIHSEIGEFIKDEDARNPLVSVSMSGVTYSAEVEREVMIPEAIESRSQLIESLADSFKSLYYGAGSKVDFVDNDGKPSLLVLGDATEASITGVDVINVSSMYMEDTLRPIFFGFFNRKHSERRFTVRLKLYLKPKMDAVLMPMRTDFFNHSSDLEIANKFNPIELDILSSWDVISVSTDFSKVIINCEEMSSWDCDD